MTEKIQELLAVLDIPEEEQWEWLWDYAKKNHLYFKGIQLIDNIFPRTDRAFWSENKERSLADLAFRLRDEAYKVAGDIYVCKAMKMAWAKCQPEAVEGYESPFDRYNSTMEWFACFAWPIHFIVAALIAKELNKET